MREIERRIAAIEGAAAGRTPSVLISVGCAGRDLQSMIGVNHVDLPRQEGESAEAFISRVEGHLYATRGLYSPLVTFARYADEEPGPLPLRGDDDEGADEVGGGSSAGVHQKP